MRQVLSLILAAGAAYTFSFAVDLLAGGLIGVYPTTAYPPVVTWGLISVVLMLGAEKISNGNRWLGLPFVAIGALATLGSIVGSHPQNLIVAGAMFLTSFILWWAFRR